MDALASFRIPLAVLKSDETSLQWQLGPDFLAIFDQEHPPLPARFDVCLEVMRIAGVITLDFLVNGVLETPCDRCLADLELDFSAEYQVVVKFGDPAESTDEVIFIDPDAPEINIGELIYDFALLSIPVSHRIPNCENLDPSPCDWSVLSHISDESSTDSGNEPDSPWDQLRNALEN